jgi:predicted 3-demethylubiquinone-9 3-methyltransferase (glyoxalase superfamily)
VGKLYVQTVVGRCGWLRDRYGVFWQIVPTALVHYLGGSDPAGAQRAMQAMLRMTYCRA